MPFNVQLSEQTRGCHAPRSVSRDGFLEPFRDMRTEGRRAQHLCCGSELEHPSRGAVPFAGLETQLQAGPWLQGCRFAVGQGREVFFERLGPEEVMDGDLHPLRFVRMNPPADLEGAGAFQCLERLDRVASGAERLRGFDPDEAELAHVRLLIVPREQEGPAAEKRFCCKVLWPA